MMRRLLLLAAAVLGVAACTKLPAGVLYRCETGGTCAVAGTSCWDDGYCHPDGDERPDAGGADAGVPDAGAPDAGAPDAGPGDAGPGDAGPPDAGPPDAGPVDAGCDCTAAACGYLPGACSQVECPWLCGSGQECGLTAPNTCALPHLCVDGGWCWENPLPQGNTLQGAAAFDARHVYAVGRAGTALWWNGERTQQLLTPPAFFHDLNAVAVSSTGEIFAVGAGPSFLYGDGGDVQLQTETSTVPTGTLWSVTALGNGAALAGGTGKVVRRVPSAAGGLRWQVETLVGLLSGEEVRGFADVPNNALVAITTSGAVYRLKSKLGTAWEREASVPATLSSVLTAGGQTFSAGSLADAGYVAVREDDAGWTPLALPGVEPVVSLGSDGPATLLVLTAAHVYRVDLDGGLPVVLDAAGDAGSPYLAAALVDGDHGLLVGQWGAMARWTGRRPVAQSSGSTRRINALCGVDATLAYAASTNSGDPADFAVRGLTRQFNSSGVWWDATDVVLDGNTEALGCYAGSGRVWLPGNQGRGLFLDANASTYSAWDFGSDHGGPHYGAYAPPGGPFYFAAGASVDFTRDAGDGNTSFTRVVLDAGTDIRAVSGIPGGNSDPHQLYAVGMNGSLWTCGGGSHPVCTTRWEALSAPSPTDNMLCVSGDATADAGNVYMVAGGEQGAIWKRPTSQSFTRVSPVKYPTVTWTGAWVARETLEPWLAGTDTAPVEGIPGGVVAHGTFASPGGTFAREYVAVSALTSVWGAVAGQGDAGATVWVGGPGGVILKRDLP